MCRVLEVSRSALYAWRESRPRRAERARANGELVTEISRVHAASRSTYGSPRVHAKLRREGVRIGRKRVERLMRAAGLRGKIRRRWRNTTDSNHPFPLAPNTLNRQFSAPASDSRWVVDITYIPIAGGFGYLAVIVDLHSRMIVGWALEDHLRTELAVKALHMALGSRVPAANLLHHSDRGCQYASASYRALLEQHGIEVSMSRRGNCYDNAVVESFFGTLKQELVHGSAWATLAEARVAIHDYVEVFYNRQRLHSSLGYRTPAEVDKLSA
jgi:transposase InsO family protein